MKQHLDTSTGAGRRLRRGQGAPGRAHDLRSGRRQGLRLVGVGAAVIRRRTVLGAAGASLLAAPALAQAYPNKPLKMVVPYPPGGGTDGLGRITAERLADKLGQQIIVQNIGGASSTVGSETVRRADPDGYTILFNASLFVLGKTIMPSCPYDPQTDFRADRPGGRGAAGAAGQPQRAGHRLRQHDGGDRQGAEEVLLRPVVGRLGRPHRDARVPAQAPGCRSTPSSTRARRRPTPTF